MILLNITDHVVRIQRTEVGRGMYVSSVCGIVKTGGCGAPKRVSSTVPKAAPYVLEPDGPPDDAPICGVATLATCKEGRVGTPGT